MWSWSAIEGEPLMLYNLLYPLAGDIQLFNLFKYLTFRSGGAIITALDH
jgi:phospho-N-acetylmuramoyl-pentapeptide-transferase